MQHGSVLPRHVVRPPARHPAVLLGILPWLLAGCGRIGVDLLPEPSTTDDDPATQGTGADAATPWGEAGAGAGASAPPDPCPSTCANHHGSALCVSGVCRLTCSAGYTDCDGDGRNGCETNIASDPAHCGTCARACDLSAQLCENGVCTASPCPPGRAECDADSALMCETDLSTSAENCGFCGNPCLPQHALGGCQDRRCAITRCDQGYADCDADPQTGCEASLDSVQNCGMCGRVCPAQGGTPSCNAGTCSVSCSMTGSFALRLTIPTTWPATALVAAGSGDFSLWGLVQLAPSQGALGGTFTPCGELVPDFRATPLVSERYGLIFPNALFDGSEPLPAVATAAVPFGTSPGSRFTLAPTAFVIGARLADPVNDAWPSASTLGTSDVDRDGKPAASLPYKTAGLDYTAPPVNTVGSFRAETAYLATRFVFSLDGALDSCIASSGTVSTRDVDSHTVGCRIYPNLRDCLSLEAAHLDANTPDFVPGSGRYTLLKLQNGGSCAAVRAALP
jgi:hypothetical protein